LRFFVSLPQWSLLLSMVLGQMVMVLVMVITSLHMRDHHHELTDISAVIASHTFGMYAFSIISGRLADRWGRGAVILIGSATLVSCLHCSNDLSRCFPLGVALFLLGLGWNFCFVGGSTLLADQLSPLPNAHAHRVSMTCLLVWLLRSEVWKAVSFLPRWAIT
jgi:MFS family permease